MPASNCLRQDIELEKKIWWPRALHEKVVSWATMIALKVQTAKGKETGEILYVNKLLVIICFCCDIDY